MNPEEMSEDLINLFSVIGDPNRPRGIMCAIACVDRIINAKPSRKAVALIMTGQVSVLRSDAVYWKKVKKILENKADFS
jgi:hypothetical protein